MINHNCQFANDENVVTINSKQIISPKTKRQNLLATRCNQLDLNWYKFSCRLLGDELGGCCERGGSRVLLNNDDAGSLLGRWSGRRVEL